MHPLLIACIVAIGAVLIVWANAVVVVRRSQRERVLGPRGVIAGAEPIRLDGGPEAVLLLHGGGDTPQSLAYLADRLHARGYTVRVPLLAGHGATVLAFSRSTAAEWLESARDAYRELRRDHQWVAIVGQSMGGALAVQLAADEPRLPALCLVSPYLSMPRRLACIAAAAPLVALVLPYPRSADERSIHDPAERARSLGYGVFPVRALAALRRTVKHAAVALPRVAAPTLVVQSREDNRIAAAAAQRAFDRLGAPEKRLVWMAGAGHVLTVDYGREHVFELLMSWLAEHGGAPKRASRATQPTP